MKLGKTTLTTAVKLLGVVLPWLTQVLALSCDKHMFFYKTARIGKLKANFKCIYSMRNSKDEEERTILIRGIEMNGATR